ncbi:xylose isomerase-like protein [Eremomyces bilateralis CBS 781.70]|uniref:Xylose isomerase-like protein n=1 Tax=Eremomyces bilateralis CBS 781.70 TaxID=1392243 RepID=A0A6G1GFF1_9PEZI|nr:xylose isomerase-like protein [Eremomyces bilateralis CBS 781.70]KAF1816754.1 xylose isomerase-like protein [Eremomyces bilateralis CBS 781.70]
MSLRPAISSMSLGRAAVHDLPGKLDQAQQYGITGIEIFYEDLEAVAQSIPRNSRQETHLFAAHKIRSWCDERNLKIICLQPFMHYEGLKDRSEHARRISKIKLWFKVVQILRTEMILIPSSFLSVEEITGEKDVIVEDMREIADLGAKETPIIRFAYESLGWGTFINTWDQCWDIVVSVDRPNFGICLDTFNIAAKVYANPAAPSGRTSNADQAIKDSIRRLIETVQKEKVFFIQVVDAERLEEPLIEGHPLYHPSQPACLSWSRNCRLFYGEERFGGYLPIKLISLAIIHELRYEGWVSMELFNRIMADPSQHIPEHLASRAAESWRRFVEDMDLRGNQGVDVNSFRPVL